LICCSWRLSARDSPVGTLTSRDCCKKKQHRYTSYFHI
jgi:hypothetical protein